jgi:hypothetical protein
MYPLGDCRPLPQLPSQLLHAALGERLGPAGAEVAPPAHEQAVSILRALSIDVPTQAPRQSRVEPDETLSGALPQDPEVRPVVLLHHVLPSQLHELADPQPTVGEDPHDQLVALGAGGVLDPLDLFSLEDLN